VVRRERAEWERVFAEFNRLAPANATVKQIEARLELADALGDQLTLGSMLLS